MTRNNDTIHRQALLNMYECLDADSRVCAGQVVIDIKALPPAEPTRKKGKWIYDKTIQNWRCSECNETPKTLGFVGTADFMADHFQFCNHCGSFMMGAEREVSE